MTKANELTGWPGVIDKCSKMIASYEREIAGFMERGIPDDAAVVRTTKNAKWCMVGLRNGAQREMKAETDGLGLHDER